MIENEDKKRRLLKTRSDKFNKKWCYIALPSLSNR